MLVDFDNAGWGGPPEDGYGFVHDITMHASGGEGGGSYFETTIPGELVDDDEVSSGLYLGYPRLDRTGIIGARVDLSVADSDGWPLIEVWEGDWIAGVYVVGGELQVFIVNPDDLSDVALTDLTYSFSASTFQLVELKWTVSSLDTATNLLNSDGFVELRIDGDVVGTATGLRVGHHLPEGWTRDVQYNVVIVNPHGKMSWFYFCDGSSDRNNDYLPSGLQIYTRFPQTGHGKYNELALSTGTDAGALVDDATSDNDSTYLYSIDGFDGAARKTTMECADFPDVPLTKQIIGLKQVASGKKLDSCFHGFRPIMVRNNLDRFGPVFYPIGVGYFNWQIHVWELDPYTNKQFKSSNVNTTQFGEVVG